MVNVIEFFKTATANAGMIINDPIQADSTLHRCHVEGDKSGTKNGAYVLHVDGNPAGWYQHFSSGIVGTWTLSGKREPMTDTMRAQIEAERQRRQAEQQQRHKDAAITARHIWRRAKPIGDPSQHPYLIRKRIKPYLARLYRDALAIPIFNESRELVNLQFIDADGNKRFLSGGKKKACFSVIGDSSKEKKLLICEGYATGASLHQELSTFVMVAMDAGNLEPAAQVARRLFPDYEIIIAGDNDESGTGQQAARTAALAVGGKYIIPATPGHDWNDALNMEVA